MTLMMNESEKKNKILIIDDTYSNILLIEEILQEEGYQNYTSIQDPRKTIDTIESYQPDLILLDLHMPHMDGYSVMKQLKEKISKDIFLPILVLTADITPDAKRSALADGATDFLAKPFDYAEVVLRIRNLLQTRSMHLQLHNQKMYCGTSVFFRFNYKEFKVFLNSGLRTWGYSKIKKSKKCFKLLVCGQGLTF